MTSETPELASEPGHGQTISGRPTIYAPGDPVIVYEHQKSGQLVSFEIRNVGRSRACRIVQTLIPSTLLARRRADEFATFTLNGKTFVLEEPFGDNSRYLVYQRPPQPSAELEALKAAFEGHRTSWFFSGDNSFRVIMGALLLVIVAIVLTIIVLLR